MNRSTRILSLALSSLENWYSSTLIPFFESLSSVQKICLILGLIPLPIYILDGQLFVLFGIISDLVHGNEIPLIQFLALLGETFLIFYSVSLFIQFLFEGKGHTLTVKKAIASGPHPCIVFKEVPLHLRFDEKKIVPNNDLDVRGSFIDPQNPNKSFQDALPEALEIMKNNAAMLDIYNRYHDVSEETKQEASQSKSLAQILDEQTNPVIESADDLEKFIQT